ncbi:hypothetical protein [Parapedobacter sp. DT-150]
MTRDTPLSAATFEGYLCCDGRLTLKAQAQKQSKRCLRWALATRAG